LAAGDVDRAVEAGRFLLEQEEAATGIAFAVDLGVEGLVGGGAIADARKLWSGFDRQPWMKDTPHAVRALGRIELAEDNAAGAIRHFEAALAAYAAAGYRPDEARTLLLLARALAAVDSAAEARRRVASAGRIAAELGATTLLREAEREMQELGAVLETVSIAMADHTSESAPGERLVSVLFADVRGYTALTSSIPPADLADRVSALQRWVLAEVERHHGVLDKFAGDALMATFNVSGASVDHCLHALQTALAVRDKAALLGLPVGAGIATGAAVVGRMAQGANLSVLGEATNLAARLQGRAGAGEILLSEESYRRVSTWLSDRAISAEAASLTLKGIDGESLAFRLAAPAGVATV
jgi:adenylate cyclase